MCPRRPVIDDLAISNGPQLNLKWFSRIYEPVRNLGIFGISLFLNLKIPKTLEPKSATNKNPQTYDRPHYKNRSDNHLNKYFPILIHWAILNSFGKNGQFRDLVSKKWLPLWSKCIHFMTTSGWLNFIFQKLFENNKTLNSKTG